MSKSKVDMLEFIKESTEMMRPMLEKAGCTTIIDVTEDMTTLKVTFLREAYHWMQSIVSTYYADVRAIRRLLPDSEWAKYEAWGNDDLREYVLLKQRLTILRKAWVSAKRPGFFKKGGIERERKRAAAKGRSQS